MADDADPPVVEMGVPPDVFPFTIIAERDGTVVWSATISDAGVLHVPGLDPPPDRVYVRYSNGTELEIDDGL